MFYIFLSIFSHEVFFHACSAKVVFHVLNNLAILDYSLVFIHYQGIIKNCQIADLNFGGVQKIVIFPFYADGTRSG